MPVGVCSATIVAPETFTVPLIPDVVSTSAKKGKLKQAIEEKRKTFLKSVFIGYPKINKKKVLEHSIPFESKWYKNRM